MNLFYYYIICIILTSIIFIYWYLTKNYDYWTKMGVKGPKPLPGLGNLHNLSMSEQTLSKLNWIQKYGKVYGYFYASKPVLTVADPELLKTILVKDFQMFPDHRAYKHLLLHPIASKNLFMSSGDDWKRLRLILNKPFSSPKLKKFFPLVSDCLVEFSNQLDIYSDNKQLINCKEMYENFTMSVLIACCFALKINAHKDRNNPFIQNALKMTAIKYFNVTCLLTLPHFILRFLNINWPFSVKSTEFLFDSTRHILENRRKSNLKHNDFIQLIMDAAKYEHESEGDKDALDENNNRVKEKQINKQLTEDEILGQTFAFFIAGYETIATTFTFATYELALNPHIQDKLYTEISQAISESGDSYEPDVLINLPYLDAFVCETLRHHPPLLRTTRSCAGDYSLANTNIKLFKDQQVEIPIYLIHHLEEFYPDPYTFNPDRFLSQNKNNINQFTYLPFGAGPRYCVGMKFALNEIKFGLAHIISKYRILKNEKTISSLQYKKSFVFNIPKNVLVSIEKR